MAMSGRERPDPTRVTYGFWGYGVPPRSSRNLRHALAVVLHGSHVSTAAVMSVLYEQRGRVRQVSGWRIDPMGEQPHPLGPDCDRGTDPCLPLYWPIGESDV